MMSSIYVGIYLKHADNNVNPDTSPGSFGKTDSEPRNLIDFLISG